jgi:hypothetical protein
VIAHNAGGAFKLTTGSRVEHEALSPRQIVALAVK